MYVKKGLNDYLFDRMMTRYNNNIGRDDEDGLTLIDYLIPYRLLGTGKDLKTLEEIAEYLDCDLIIRSDVDDEYIENFNKLKDIAIKRHMVSPARIKYIDEINLLNGVEIGLDLKGREFVDGV